MTTDLSRVIAGVDGSPHSAAALAWAAADARLRETELLVVTVCGRDVPQTGPSKSPPTTAASQQACQDIPAQMLQALPAGPAPHVRTQVLHGDPVRMLTGAATEKDVLVVGTRGRSRLRSLLLGSVAQGCAERAPCPVVVVPSQPRATALQPVARGPVVAGVEPSAEARAALRFAAEEAMLRDVPLLALHAVYPDYARSQASSEPGAPGNNDLLPPLASARAQLDALIHSELAGAGLTAQPLAVYGDPERVLLTWTASATLVAVGTRGSGRLHAALLGSVSTRLLQHSLCPVAVVSSPRTSVLVRDQPLGRLPANTLGCRWRRRPRRGSPPRRPRGQEGPPVRPPLHWYAAIGERHCDRFEERRAGGRGLVPGRGARLA